MLFSDKFFMDLRNDDSNYMKVHRMIYEMFLDIPLILLPNNNL